MPTRLRLELTPHEQAALLTVLGDYITKPDAIEVSVDAATGAELEIATLLARVMNAVPVEGATAIRMYYQTKGAHVHCRVFSGIGKVGDLTFSLEEWPAVHERLACIADVRPDDEPSTRIAETRRKHERPTESGAAD